MPASVPSDTMGASTARPVAHHGRSKVAVLLVLGFSLLSARTMLVAIPVGTYNDMVAAYEKRFDGLRRALPARGVIGYVSDSDFFGDLYLTEYALAPRVVDRPFSGYPPFSGSVVSGQTPAVVGNFTSPANIPRVAAENGLIVSRDFGSGVVLLVPETR